MLEQVWGLHEDTDTRAIDNFIVRLRRYIEKEPARPKHLLTVRGVGYRFIASPGCMIALLSHCADAPAPAVVRGSCWTPPARRLPPRS